MSQPYPQLNFADVTFLITTIRNREVEAKVKQFAKSFYTVEGALLGMLVGEPEEVNEQTMFGSVQSPTYADLKDLAAACQDLHAESNSEGFGAGKIGDGTILNIILQNLPTIIAAIMALLAKNPNANPADLVSTLLGA